MQKYDVVLLLDPKLAETQRKAVMEEMENSLGKSIAQKDEIGLQVLKHNLGGKTGQDSAYMVSYLVEAQGADMIEFKKNLVYNKAIKRSVIFKMTPKEIFFSFADLQKELTEIIAARDQKKVGQKLIFFMDTKNEKYLNWKAVPMLQKYISRFGDIKPRKYTGNSVSTQKKLREAVIRARELGVLKYVSN